MWNLMTLDGYFEGAKKWDLGFHEQVYGPELEELGLQQLESAGAILYGRVTYEGMASYWQSARGRTAELMNSVPKIVFSRTLEEATWNNTRLVREGAEDEVARLKREDGGDLYVIGSADLSASLMARDLFDEYRLCIAPTVLGAGTPLFKPTTNPKPFRTREARTLKTGGILLFCEPAVGSMDGVRS
jgi:dihydrofolate reductase